MRNDKHYTLHPNQSYPPIMTCEIPLEEYESLKRENERLNRELEHVKNGDCIYTCDVVEKHVKEELKAKRALWMARGYIMTLLNRDFQRLAYQCNNDDYKKNLLRRRNQYYELSEKCLEKVEEYK